MNKNVFIMDHPLIQHKISLLRNKDTGPKKFRELISEIAMLTFYEATRDMELTDIKVTTPVGEADGKVLAGRNIALVSILRAGEGMLNGVLELVPTAKVGHIGLYRDPLTLKPNEYYCKLPVDIDQRSVFVVDPMLATGGTAIDAISQIKKRGAKNIKFLCIVAATEGVKALQETHPDVTIYGAALDKNLNDHGYIVPGLGDAGDRIFGTK